jgi:hypothetical protein
VICVEVGQIYTKRILINLNFSRCLAAEKNFKLKKLPYLKLTDLNYTENVIF